MSSSTCTDPCLLPLTSLEQHTEFAARHIGPTDTEQHEMLQVIGPSSRAQLIQTLLPPSIARAHAIQLPPPASEAEALAELKQLASQNQILKSFIGQGYHGTLTPTVILRNILENPAWYTAYTPYQAEISQGRMEALVNFQTMVCDLTGLPIANASMLDEATSAAEAMSLAARAGQSNSKRFIVAHDVLPQTLEVIQTRAQGFGLNVEVQQANEITGQDAFAVLLQYPGVNGQVRHLQPIIERVHQHGALAIVAADLLALTLLTPPGEMGADIAIGTSQRFGMPMGNGGPHAAYLAVKDEFKRAMPGRLVGVSVDTHGTPAYRLALQTREQHIRREKATSNICTAQVLPAVVASMYAVYHGPQGLKRIAQRIASYTAILAQGLQQLGWRLLHNTAFDTLQIEVGINRDNLLKSAREHGFNLRSASTDTISITLDETTTRADITKLWTLFARGQALPTWDAFDAGVSPWLPSDLLRTSSFLTHPVFHRYHSETELLRYIRLLADKDLALDRSMIPLGSCTMKLNATSEMIPITWPEFAQIHPFAPPDQLKGYELLNEQLCQWLNQATGYAGISLQPNAGSQGEYAGLLIIQAYHAAHGQAHRRICLIPESAHGTNPASAHMVGMQVVVVKCDPMGNVDLDDLRAKCEQHAEHLAAAMITYPSTYGIFEPRVKELCAIVHQYGGRVYVDGANMNALVGLAAPGEFGGDVSHLNLHKTFCIPHGGGGPGVGPVCVVADLVPYLPAHRSAGLGEATQVGAVSAAPLGNAAVLPISWMYMRMMGAAGLQAATEVAILNANYIAARLAEHYDIHFSSEHAQLKGGGVAHECILDLRPLKESSGVSAEDVAKRLIDYGFHAPTLSFPVAGTLMVEPTESESKTELDRFCDAMIAIRQEIRQIEQGHWSKTDNPLKNAPHTAAQLLKADWPHPYPRTLAAYPVASLLHQKYWSPVGRVDNVYGDRNLFCSCVPIE